MCSSVESVVCGSAQVLRVVCWKCEGDKQCIEGRKRLSQTDSVSQPESTEPRFSQQGQPPNPPHTCCIRETEQNKKTGQGTVTDVKACNHDLVGNLKYMYEPESEHNMAPLKSHINS